MFTSNPNVVSRCLYSIHVLAKGQKLPIQVDCDRYLLEKMELSKGYIDGEHYPLLRHYARRVMIAWGWSTTYGSLEADPDAIKTDPDNQNSNQNDPKVSSETDMDDFVFRVDHLVYYLLYKLNIIHANSKQRKQQLNVYRSVMRSSLFWSITVAIGGILGYALFYKT